MNRSASLVIVTEDALLLLVLAYNYTYISIQHGYSYVEHNGLLFLEFSNLQ